MSLTIKRQEPKDKHARGLSAEARESYHVAYAGSMEFGHFFCVRRGQNEVWRWVLEFPVLEEASGTCGAHPAAQEKIEEAYDMLLDKLALFESKSRNAHQPLVAHN